MTAATDAGQRARAEAVLGATRKRYASHTGLLLRNANLAEIAVPNSVAVQAMLAFASPVTTRTGEASDEVPGEASGIDADEAREAGFLCGFNRAREHPEQDKFVALEAFRVEYAELADELKPAPSASPVPVDARGAGPTLEQQVARIFNNERPKWWNSLTDAQRRLFMRDSAVGKDEAFKAGVRAALSHTAPVADAQAKEGRK